MWQFACRGYLPFFEGATRAETNPPIGHWVEIARVAIDIGTSRTLKKGELFGFCYDPRPPSAWQSYLELEGHRRPATGCNLHGTERVPYFSLRKPPDSSARQHGRTPIQIVGQSPAFDQWNHHQQR